MNIKDVSSIGNLRVEINSDFKSLGLVSQIKDEMLIFIESENYISEANKNESVKVAITKEEFKDSFREDITLAFSDNPRESFFKIHNYLFDNTDFYGTSFENDISQSAKIYPNVYIAPKSVKIGENVVIEPNVVIMENVIIEDNVIVRAGSVIGSEGFEYKRLGDTILSVKHAGGVIIRKKAEIGSNCCVDKAVFSDFTEIGEDTKLDNLVHVAHEVKIGKRVFIPAGVIISGSVIIEDDVWIGPNATISNGLRIGENAFVSLGAVVINDVKDGERVSGNFAIDHRKLLRFLVKIMK